MTTGGLIFSGIRSSGKSLTKAPINSKEMSNPGFMSNQTQEAQLALNKYFNYQYEIQK